VLPGFRPASQVFLLEIYGNIKSPHPKGANTSFSDLKTWLMISRPLINRIIIIAFIALVAIALVYGIRSKSITGIILSLTSLGAAIHFLNLLSKARREMEQEQEEAA
jgi:p-aminobenzoyl-glutamate transporter AbgT